ncbi:tRNA (5-methylaminomethyl-2-thiouridine)(34)-methyltransferase MnmD [Algivirga pacifica]|uniref:tRNA (5-methylaminomethyl-2-thiouridine)(34)-methyltransferase MnmD n=1 Tax=Algivirga pacifica TaxID=1162670 RepID=A0ABP9D561_9BACT
MKNIKVIETGDGSSTLYNESLNETYHSSHGAVTESLHVFLKSGLEDIAEKTKAIRILEIGFGTGLNAILTIQKALTMPDHHIHYTSLETFPLSKEIVEGLNYKSMLPEELHGYFDQIHNAPWNEAVDILPNFTLKKVNEGLETFELEEEDNPFNLYYYDAFAPNKQPELWEVERFQKCYDMAEEGALLVTYCAQGQFRRNLKAAGFTMEKWPGPPGKREMTRGHKIGRC